MIDLLTDHTELYRQFSDDESFRRVLSEMIFATTYSTPATPATVSGTGIGQ